LGQQEGDLSGTDAAFHAFHEVATRGDKQAFATKHNWAGKSNLYQIKELNH